MAVQHFHEQLNAGRYEEICREADEGLTQGGKQQEVGKFLEGVHAKLGDVSGEHLLSITVNTTTGGTFTVGQYNTTFARGSAVETFTWVRAHGALKLYGYDIRSNALVVN